MAPRSKRTSNIDRGLDNVLPLITAACRLAGPLNFVEQTRDEFRESGLLSAVRRHDTAALFDWLMTILSYQGIADRLAEQYLREHGSITWAEIEAAVSARPECPKLGGFWCFDSCRYEKLAGKCSQPQYISSCPVPRHDLRNGRLNQTAYSLFFFIRDVADGDLVQWMDRQLAAAWSSGAVDRLAACREALIAPLRGVFGVSDKVISMALSSLLLAAGHGRRHWIEVGASFIVIDSLVHNFLHRTGILRRCGVAHAYGPACYRPGNCADLLARFAQHIDASSFNPDFPKAFPRFVQLSVWRFCSQTGLDICNGNRITDGKRCDHVYCRLRQRCERIALPRPKPTDVTARSMLPIDE